MNGRIAMLTSQQGKTAQHILTAVLLGIGMLQSQNFWTRTEPYTATLNKMYFGTGDTVYGTLNSGFTRSTDNGSTWSLAVIVNFVTDMSVAPNGTIYLSENQQKMSRSTNKGASFTIIGTGITETSCSSVLTTSVAGTVIAGTSTGIYRSTNNGDAWTKVAGKTQLDGDTTVASFARNGATLFAVTNSNGVFPTRAALLRSTDDGATWTKGNASLDSVSAYKMLGLANGTIVVRTNNALRATTDQGNSWSALGFYNDYIYDIAEGPAGTLYAMLNRSGEGCLYKSTNNGQSWQNVPAPVNGGGSLAANPAGHLFFGRDQLYRSTDGGANWKGLPLAFPNVTMMKENAKKELFVASGGSAYQGLYRSTDGGTSWKFLNTSVVGVPSVGFYGDTILVGDNYYNATLFRSIDNGATFKSVTGISVLSGYINAVIGTTYRSIIAGTSTGIFRSTDHGKVWKQVSTTPATVLQQLPNGTMYAFRTFSGSGIFRSVDSGSTWTELKNGMGNTLVHSLAFAPNGNLFSGSDAGLFRSTNNGDAWVRIDTQNVKPYGIYVTVNGDGTLFFGGAKNGVNSECYRSSDNGASWTNITNNITTIDNQATFRTLFTASNGMLFAGTSSGLFRSTQKTTDVAVSSSIAPNIFGLDQNYPNPFNPTTAIKYHVGTDARPSSNVVLKVYDQLGREVATLVNEVKAPGTYTARFDASHLSSGVYLYSLRTGNTVSSRRMLLLK